MIYLKQLSFLVVLIFIAALFQSTWAQPDISLSGFERKRDTAIDELKKFPDQDTNRVNALIKIFTTATYLKERETVVSYRQEAFALSKRLNYLKGMAICYLGAGNYYKSASNYSEALRQFDSVLLVTSVNDPSISEQRAIAHERIGFIYNEQGNYYAALDHLFESLKYPEPKSVSRTVRVSMLITDIYLILDNLDRAEEYAKKSELLLEKDTSRSLAQSVYFNMIDVSIARRDFKNAVVYLDKIAPYVPDPVEVQVNFGYYIKRGDLSSMQENHPEALKYYQQAFKYAILGGHRRSRNAVLRRLSNSALKMGDYETAKSYALENLELAEEINIRSEKIEALTNLSEYYKSTGDLQKSVELLQQAMQLKDSVAVENNTKQMNILAAIYETDKQNKEISKLQTEKEKEIAGARYKSALNRFLIAATILLLVFGYLGYTNFRKGQQLAVQQQTIQKQKIKDLEKDKQLLTINAMLKGQEEERSRIAKDLHDGLGSLLSGTKLSFLNVKENLVMSAAHASMFEKSLSMLDNTIVDLRKVSHNLMPEGLMKFGLAETLKDFCESIHSNSGLRVLYQQFGEDRRLDSTAEVFIYRIVQELVTNAVKHAEASEIIVQLVMGSEKVSVTVEDNGKGFDAEILSRTKGAGMSNIQYRLQYFHGMMDLVTSPGKGTSVNIELIA